MTGEWTSLGWAFGLALPALVALGLWGYVRRRRRAAARLGNRSLIAGLIGEDLLAVPWLRMGLVLGAAVLLGVAATDPRWGAPEATAASGGRVVLVLDASTSMLAEDLAPNRMERQRAAAHALARRLPDAAMAVVMFAGRAYALVPPTTDRSSLDLFLSSLDPSMVTQTGSSLTAAVRQGLGLLAAGEAGDALGALVLITDGDTLDDDEQVRAAAELARRAGVPIHVLGAGTAQGAPVPDIDLATGRDEGYLRDPAGALIVSRRRDDLLRPLAQGSGGTFAELGDPRAVDRLVEQLRRARSGSDSSGGEAPPRFTWFAAGALALLLLERAAVARRAGGRP